MLHTLLVDLPTPGLPDLVTESTSRVRKGLKTLAFYCKVSPWLLPLLGLLLTQRSLRYILPVLVRNFLRDPCRPLAFADVSIQTRI